ncbi:DUF7544 domain-containing protein [Halobaculum gomorrense]|uniref:Uncharacterized protein n=1 Tax=Halobaculum gomorrense TaxID=43928 RepID=A0A1M5TI98_9EURY|nr:hypothetical protein [Halobaculum gomorrense]SHH50419.1 hypothetical protein SAMN05443636_2722 [Halobaculum gomorrense]
MSWHGVDAVDDAIDVTREFLFPFSVGRWIRMAVVSLFTGGGGGAGQIASNAGNLGARLAGTGYTGTSGNAGAWAALVLSVPAVLVGAVATSGPLRGADGLLRAGQALRTGSVLQAGRIPEVGAVGTLGIAFLVVVLAVVLIAVLLPPIFEFVLVDAIASDDLRVLRDARTHLTNGIRLIGFRIGLFAAFVVPPAAVVAAVVLTDTRVAPLFDNVPVVVALALVALAYVLAFAFLDRFTVEFVVPAMVADGGGVIDGWRRVWPRLREQLGQTVVYIVMHVLVGIGVSIVSVVLLLVGLLAVGAVAAGIGFAVGAVTSGAVSTDVGVGVGVFAGAAVGIPVFVAVVLLPIQVLTVTYQRAYELAALGRFSESLDLVGRYRDDGDDEDDDDTAFSDDGGDEDDDGGDEEDGGENDDTPEADEFGGFVPASTAVEEPTDGTESPGDTEEEHRGERE